jgi:uncharacterized protein (TIGR02217 family)
MTFFDIRLPTDISYGAVGGPEFSTTLSTTKSGSEVKIKNWSQPRYKYNIMYGLKNRNQMQKLINFFNVCQGKSAHFRYKDWLDYIATDSFVANGDGVKTKFPLVKQYNFEKYTMARTINLPIISTIADEDFYQHKRNHHSSPQLRSSHALPTDILIRSL